MNREDIFIQEVAQKSRYIGDDGAYIDGVIYSQDAFFEDVHFKRSWMSLEQIAYKAMIVNISDAIAMNAIPKYALITLAMPRSIKVDEIRELNRGFYKAASHYGIEIIGGDTIANCKLDISVTIISKTKRPLMRRGLKEGDILAYTNTLGRSKRELGYLLAGGKLHKDSTFIAPRLNAEFIYAIASKLHVGMDISDGLFSDTAKLLRENKMGLRPHLHIDKGIGCSGEEYEMLIGFSKRELKSIKRYASRYNVKINIIGEVIRGRYLNRCKANHF